MPLIIHSADPETPDEVLTPPYEQLEKAKKPLGWLTKLKNKLKKKK
jgi:hypothetical protein